MTDSRWPGTEADLVAAQERLAAAEPPRWAPPPSPAVAGCWGCFPRGVSGPGRAGDPAWVAAVSMQRGRGMDEAVAVDTADAPYRPGLMALRIGRLLQDAVERLPRRPDVLLVDATARDHPRRAGLALHLGAVLDVPTIGVTHRPLRADGPWPGEARGAASPLRLDGQVVGCWLRTAPGTRPLAVHPGWRVDLATAVETILAVSERRTPEPLRRARQLARRARAVDEVR